MVDRQTSALTLTSVTMQFMTPVARVFPTPPLHPAVFHHVSPFLIAIQQYLCLMSVRRRAIAAAAGPMPQLQLLPISQQADQIPPPSSVAVIVQNLSKAGDASTGIVDRDIFQQLLAEVLGPDGADPSDTAWFEDNIGVNYKVVEVVMDAGISILLQEDPFASTNDLLLQATNSLLVVRLTIQRSPQVLFCPPPAEHTTEANRPVLFLWLLPRLLPLLGHRIADTLKQELLETIEALFVAAARTPDAWKYLTTAMRYCRSCVNCTLFLTPLVNSDYSCSNNR